MHSSTITFAALGLISLASATPADLKRAIVTTTSSNVCTSTIPTPACASPTSTTYLQEPCFPNTGVCYPTNYYAAQDQGQMSISAGSFDSQLYTKCKATCDSRSQCSAFVATENITPDGTLATGTCFFYSTQSITPRQCADSSSRIIAYYKAGVCKATTTSSSSTTTKATTTSSSTTTKAATTTSSSSTTTKATTTSSSTTSSSTTASSTTSSSTTTASTTTASTTTASTTTASTTTASTTTASTTTSSTTTSSTTTTTSSTTTSAAPTPTCTDATDLLGTSSTCGYYQYCEQNLVGNTSGSSSYQANEEACLSLCDSVNRYQSVSCRGYSFNYDTGACQLFSQVSDVTDAVGVRSGAWWYCSPPKS